MHLILLRHGKAEMGNPEGDFARGLVEKGREQSRAAARFLSRTGLLPDLVLTSPLLRARQTADHFCTTAGIPGPLVQGWLACGMSHPQAMSELAAYNDFKSVMLVGHEPDFSQLIQSLIGAAAGSVEVKKATLASLRVYPPSLSGELLSLVPSTLMA